jgi:hypothetical protein
MEEFIQDEFQDEYHYIVEQDKSYQIFRIRLVKKDGTEKRDPVFNCRYRRNLPSSESLRDATKVNESLARKICELYCEDINRRRAVILSNACHGTRLSKFSIYFGIDFSRLSTVDELIWEFRHKKIMPTEVYVTHIIHKGHLLTRGRKRYISSTLQIIFSHIKENKTKLSEYLVEWNYFNSGETV